MSNVIQLPSQDGPTFRVSDSAFTTTDKALAVAVAAELDRVDPLPPRQSERPALPELFLAGFRPEDATRMEAEWRRRAHRPHATLLLGEGVSITRCHDPQGLPDPVDHKLTGWEYR